MTQPKCEDCAHYTESGMCSRPHQIGELRVLLAPPMRRPLWAGEDQCGDVGRWFEQKEQP